VSYPRGGVAVLPGRQKTSTGLGADIVGAVTQAGGHAHVLAAMAWWLRGLHRDDRGCAAGFWRDRAVKVTLRPVEPIAAQLTRQWHRGQPARMRLAAVTAQPGRHSRGGAWSRRGRWVECPGPPLERRCVTIRVYP
jgi:hypothetical protein